MAVEFQLNHAGIAELLKSEDIKKMLEERVALVADEARISAPVITGDYKKSIESGAFMDGDRHTGYVVAKVEYACNVEVHDRTLGNALGRA